MAYINLLKKYLSRFFISKMGTCHICDRVFHESTLKIVEEMSFCEKDYARFINESWILIDQKRSDPDHPENALSLSKHKLALIKHNIPSYIRTDYREEESIIITQFKLFIPEQFAQEYNELIKKADY